MANRILLENEGIPSSSREFRVTITGVVDPTSLLKSGLHYLGDWLPFPGHGAQLLVFGKGHSYCAERTGTTQP